jgi:hypothetical protein
MYVKLLTTLQADSLVGQEFKPNEFFSPMQDANGNFVLSLIEANDCTNPEFIWVKDLPEILFVAPPFSM